MILIKKAATAKVYFPINGNYGRLTEAVLTVVSTADETRQSLALVCTSISVGGTPAPFVEANVTIPASLFIGEWEYTLTAKVEGVASVLSTGIMQVYDEAPAVTAYGSEIEYKQYGE